MIYSGNGNSPNGRSRDHEQLAIVITHISLSATTKSIFRNIIMKMNGKLSSPLTRLVEAGACRLGIDITVDTDAVCLVTHACSRHVGLVD